MSVYGRFDCTSKVLYSHQLTNLHHQLQLSWKIQSVSCHEKNSSAVSSLLNTSSTLFQGSRNRQPGWNVTRQVFHCVTKRPVSLSQTWCGGSRGAGVGGRGLNLPLLSPYYILPTSQNCHSFLDYCIVRVTRAGNIFQVQQWINWTSTYWKYKARSVAMIACSTSLIALL